MKIREIFSGCLRGNFSILSVELRADGGKMSVKEGGSGMWDRFRWLRIGFILVNG